MILLSNKKENEDSWVIKYEVLSIKRPTVLTLNSFPSF